MEPDKSIENYLRKKNPEAKLLIRTLAVLGFTVILILIAGYLFLRIQVPVLLKFSKNVSEYNIEVAMDSLEYAYFIQGMTGCENVLPDNRSGRIYISCLDGNIHELLPDQASGYRVSKSFNAGSHALGLAFAPGDTNAIYVAVNKNNPDEWKSKGGAVNRLAKDFSSLDAVTGEYPSINGICFDSFGNLFFASSNFNYLKPAGAVYMAKRAQDGEFESPSVFIGNAGLANGLYFDREQERVFLSNTIGGVYSFYPSNSALNEEYLKTRFMEAFDDICTDAGGNIWMTDPGNSTVKMYNPGTNRLVRFTVKGIGQTSSCRIRTENGREMLFITELKQSMHVRSKDYNGRGVLVVPAQSLIKLLEPYLIVNKTEP